MVNYFCMGFTLICAVYIIMLALKREYISTLDLQFMVRLRFGSSYVLDIQNTGEKKQTTILFLSML